MKFYQSICSLIVLGLSLLVACGPAEPKDQPGDPTESPQTAAQPKTPPATTPTPLVAFSQEDLWGFRDEAGAVVIEPRFRMANDFHPDGGAAVVDDEGWAYIDRTGKVLLRPFIYDNGPDYFQEGLARFIADGKMGFFNPAGEIVIPATHDFAKPFKDGRAEVCTGCQKIPTGEHSSIEGGSWHAIDKTGKNLN